MAILDVVVPMNFNQALDQKHPVNSFIGYIGQQLKYDPSLIGTDELIEIAKGLRKTGIPDFIIGQYCNTYMADRPFMLPILRHSVEPLLRGDPMTRQILLPDQKVPFDGRLQIV